MSSQSSSQAAYRQRNQARCKSPHDDSPPPLLHVQQALTRPALLGCRYISGKPGTGKTATVGHVVRSLHPIGVRPKVVQFNCMSASDPKQVYTEILAAVSGSQVSRSMTADEMVRQLESKYLVKASGRTGRVVLLVLDEVDQLETRSSQSLESFYNSLSHGANISISGKRQLMP